MHEILQLGTEVLPERQNDENGTGIFEQFLDHNRQIKKNRPTQAQRLRKHRNRRAAHALDEIKSLGHDVAQCRRHHQNAQMPAE